MIIKILNKFKIFEDHRIEKFSNIKVYVAFVKVKSLNFNDFQLMLLQDRSPGLISQKLIIYICCVLFPLSCLCIFTYQCNSEKIFLSPIKRTF